MPAAFLTPDVKTRNYNLVTDIVTTYYFKILEKPHCVTQFPNLKQHCLPLCFQDSEFHSPGKLPVYAAALDRIPARSYFHLHFLQADNTYCEKWKYHNWNKGDSPSHKSFLPVSSTSRLSTPTNDFAVAGQPGSRGIWSRPVFKIRSSSCLFVSGFKCPYIMPAVQFISPNYFSEQVGYWNIKSWYPNSY